MSEFRSDVHRALDPLARPVPALHNRSMAAVRAYDARGVDRGSRFGWLAGVAALLLAMAVVGVFQLQNGAFIGHGPTRPAVDSGIWTEDLTLTGDIRGHMTSTVANHGAIRSSCTGKTSRVIGKYSLTLTLSTDQGVWQLAVDIDPYQGPGTYTRTPATASSVRAVLVNQGRTEDWSSGPDDSVVVTVDSTEEAGTVSATMSSFLSNPAGSVPPGTFNGTETINGTWTCRTSL